MEYDPGNVRLKNYEHLKQQGDEEFLIVVAMNYQDGLDEGCGTPKVRKGHDGCRINKMRME